MDEYVSQLAWARPAGRADAIDDIADQFERPATAVALPTSERAAARGRPASPRWPRSARGWRSLDRLHPRAADERLTP